MKVLPFLVLVGPLVVLGCHEPTFTLVAGGDVSLARNPGRLIAQEGVSAPFSRLEGLLASDFTVANLECAPAPTVGYPPWAGPKEAALTLQAPLASIGSLVTFDALSLANNHSLDSGLVGLKATLQALDQAGIAHAGAGFSQSAETTPVMVRSGRQVVFLSFTQPFPELEADGHRPPVAIAEPSRVVEAIRQARASVGGGLVIVSIHWGREGDPDPNVYQRTLGRACIDAGADAVLGHHPHNLQGLERRGRGVIAYSLGNLLFDSGGDENRQSALVRLTWSESRPVGVEIVPLYLEGPARVPRPARGAEARLVLSDLSSKVGRLGGHLRVTEERAVLE